VSEKPWNYGMARAGRGRTMLQMPMHCYRYPEWQKTIRDGVAKRIGEFVSSGGLRKHKGHADEDGIQTSLTHLFANTDELLMRALGAHAHLYGQVANAEAGLDLGIVGQQILIGGPPNDYVIFFATMNMEACKLLLRVDAKKFSVELSRIRRERLSATGFSGSTPRSESLMDLLCAVLPYTTDTIGAATPVEIVDRFVKARLARFVVAPGVDVGPTDHRVGLLRH
jgi:hypothetical protein